MSRPVKFVLGVVLGLALLTAIASVWVDGITRGWFERDLRMRVELAVNGARQALIERWSPARRESLETLLADIARDDRIMSAAACAADLDVLARTPDYPEALGCARLGPHVRPQARTGAGWRAWSAVSTLPGGNVNVSAVPIFDGGRPLGFVALVHDLSFIARREWAARRFLFFAFAILSAAASVLTLVTARLSFRGFRKELRRLVRGEPSRPEFQPLLKDVRDLMEQIAQERELAGTGATWTSQTLKQTLERNFRHERVVILANREPYIHNRGADGQVVVQHPASGLVTALEPVMRACSGVWIAHGSGTADREVVDLRGRLRVPPGEESYCLRRVWLTPEEEKGYYYGFSNEGLWPLCHLAHARPLFRGEDWEHYRAVNARFADAVCDEVDSDDPVVLVQDYHFALAPRYIRERLPRATIIGFWHIPWPNAESLGICPWREELLQGLLGSSIIGFHTQLFCNNFIDGVDRYLEARIDREQHAVVQNGLRSLVRPYPISIEWPSRWADQVAAPAECRASVLAELGLRADALLGVGVDRLDYTKGIEERLGAVERLLERHPELRGRFTFVQLAAPSRTEIDRYRQLGQGIEALVARVNQRFGSDQYHPIVMLRRHHEPANVFRFYRAADLCYVSSLHDGMNLVAKEFVAARSDERGVLLLSQFTGAARELTHALIVNPYDLDQAAAAMARALTMEAGEQRDRMRALRRLVAEFNVYRWAGKMLVDAARLRRRETSTPGPTQRASVTPVPLPWRLGSRG
jgi:trehalose 6-phosphate synthase